MALFQFQYGGHTSEGETFNFSFWINSAITVQQASVHALDWLNAFWTGGYDGFVTAQVGVDSIATREITQATGEQIRLNEQVVNLVGVAVGANMPADVALVVSLRTELANRRGRGRFYLPQPAASAGDLTGRLSNAAQTAILAAVTSAFNAIIPPTQPVVYSRTGRSFEPVTSFNIGNLFDTQRRRENKLLEARASALMPGA